MTTGGQKLEEEEDTFETGDSSTRQSDVSYRSESEDTKKGDLVTGMSHQFGHVPWFSLVNCRKCDNVTMVMLY